MAWGQFDEEANARRLFLEEARRRVLTVLTDLRCFTASYQRQPPAWTYERVAALAEQVTADDVAASMLDDSITAVELEVRSTLAEMAAILDVDQPIPFGVTQVATTPSEPLPAPASLRPFLLVIRGGRA